MPYLEAGPDDPMEIVGVGIPTVDDTSMLEMAECFVEELLRLGHSPERVLEIFKNPYYASAHRSYRILGEQGIREIIECYRKLFTTFLGTERP